jgi:hypothetical protein
VSSRDNLNVLTRLSSSVSIKGCPKNGGYVPEVKVLQV